LDPDQAYPALIQASIDSAGLPFTVVNAGLSGETSAGAVRRVGWLLRAPISVFVLETGANDALRGLDVDSTRAHIVAIIDSVRRRQPPNLGPAYDKAFDGMYAEIARQEHVTLLPFLLEGVAGHADLNQGDGMHPNVRGERLVARKVWRGLEPLLRETKD
jgi:acyl-CoA thioesterase-1